MIPRFRFDMIRSTLLLVEILFAISLAGCQGPAQTQSPTQPLPPARALQSSTASPTAAATGSPSPRPTLRPSSTMIPTATLLPSFTPIPTATMTLPPTPFPALEASRPYLVYYSTPGGKPSLVLINADASGRQVIAMPEGSQVPRLPQALSPNGQWLAFYTGMAGDPQKGAAAAGQFDLTLNLIRLPDGRLRTVSPLLAKDYPNSLQKVAAEIVAKDPAKGLKQADVYNQVWSVFLSGITQAEWSPDSRTLAFTGEMNGQSSNIYLYSPASGRITQATDGSEQIRWLLWSRDGRYILYGSSNQQCAGDCDTRYALDVSSRKSTPLANMAPHSGSLVVYDWTGPHSIAFYSSADGAESSYLTTIDLATGKTSDLYPNAFIDFDLDLEQGLVALTRTSDVVTQKSVQPGLYLYHADGGQLDFVASSGSTPDFNVVYWGQPHFPFLAWDQDKVYGLTVDGRLEVISESSLKAVAANRQWIVVEDTKASPPALKIIDAQKQVVNTVSARYAGRMISNLYSTGFFSVYGNGLYYLDIKTGVWRQVDAGLPEQPDWSHRPLLFGWKG